MAAFTEGIAESVCTYDCANVNFHAIANARVRIKRDARVDAAIITDPAAGADHAMCSYLRVSSDVRIFSDDCISTNACAECNFCQWRDHSRRMNAFGDDRGF